MTRRGYQIGQVTELHSTEFPILEIPENGIALHKILRSIEEDLFDRAMERCQQNRAAAARLLGVNRTTLLEHYRSRGMYNYLPKKIHREKLGQQ